MREIHTGLPFKDFAHPAEGVVDITVCAQSGLLPASFCTSKVTLTFLKGNTPGRRCTGHGAPGLFAEGGSFRAPVDIFGLDDSVVLDTLQMPVLSPDILLISAPAPRRTETDRRNTEDEPADPLNVPAPQPEPSGQSSPPDYGLELPSYNPWLD
jgi:penicillin-binding protein 1A